MAGKNVPRALPLQLLDADGRVLCRGLATLWVSALSGGSRWGGEFFQLLEGDAPRGCYSCPHPNE